MAVGTSVVNPIYQTTTFHSDPTGAGEVLYTRYGNNPNHRRVEERLRALEGTEDAVVTGSGMGAMVAALGSEMVARGRTPSALDLPADSSMPVEIVQV